MITDYILVIPCKHLTRKQHSIVQRLCIKNKIFWGDSTKRVWIPVKYNILEYNITSDDVCGLFCSTDKITFRLYTSYDRIILPKELSIKNIINELNKFILVRKLRCI